MARVPVISWIKPKRKRKGPSHELPVGHPGRPLFELSPYDAWAIKDSFEHLFICGRAGAGKSSTCGATLGLHLLQEGYSGLVISAKSERAFWESLCAATGRSDDLIIVGPDGANPMNFLEVAAASAPVGFSMLAADLLTTACQAATSNKQGNGPSDTFFIDYAKRSVTNAIDLLIFAGQQVSVDQIIRVIVSCPRDPEQVSESSWWESSECARCIRLADDQVLEPNRRIDLQRTISFFVEELSALGDRTRSSVVATLTGSADLLTRSPLREVFGSGTSWTPDDALNGKIVLVDFPSLKMGPVGKIANAIVKLMFMNAVQRRDPSEGTNAFLWSDEVSENIIGNRDAAFCATARSSRCAYIALTQSKCNIDSVIGRDAGAAFMANFGTHIAMSNQCSETNEFYSKLVGSTWQNRTSFTKNDQEKTGQNQSSLGTQISQSLDAQVPAQKFTVLRSCSPETGGQADAIVIQGGRTWNASQKNHLMTTFQRLELGS